MVQILTAPPQTMQPSSAPNGQLDTNNAALLSTQWTEVDVTGQLGPVSMGTGGHTSIAEMGS